MTLTSAQAKTYLAPIFCFPSDFSDNVTSFCQKILSENIATVKIEMASKSIQRSVKDKRFNFSSQLSTLGKRNLSLNLIF